MNVEALKQFVVTMEARLLRLEKACAEVRSNIEAAAQMIKAAEGGTKLGK